MAALPLLIAGGRVIDPASGIDGPRDVLIRGDRIAAVERGLLKKLGRGVRVRRLDASGRWVIPGIIDMHVHLREPGGEDSETLESGTRAAACGGATTVLAMANTRPAMDSPALLKRARRRADKTAWVNVLFAAAVTKGLLGERLTAMERLAKAGAAAFSDDGRPVMDAGLMREAMSRARTIGLPILDHAEDLGLTGDGVIREGPASLHARVPGIPEESEVLMAMRDIALARLTASHLHICHVSCAGTVDLVREAKKRGIRVTAEAAPHHFTLSDEDIPDGPRRAADFKMKPPLGSPEDREAIREGLADGTIDAIATDHAPHTPNSKARGLVRAPFGVIGLESLVPLSMALLNRRGLTPKRLVDCLSAAPARILDLRSKGRLSPGADADVTLIDPDAKYRLFADFASRSSNCPFTGRRVRGAASATVVGGRVVFDASMGDPAP